VSSKRAFYVAAVLVLFSGCGYGQTTLSADGPGNTYSLITSVLAPGHNPIETPDCNHVNFGDHIDEIWDSILGENVFRFHIHVTPDNDRCINFDRQRNEIKTYDKSPNNLKGTPGEIVEYSWLFKLESGFKSSSNFTHIHQLKSVGGSLASMPMYTLTTRKSSPDRLELRYAETDTQVTLAQTPLLPITGQWIEAIETVQYGTAGSYSITLKAVSDSTTLFSYTNDSIINWRAGADFVRPKWGVYRSLINSQDLQDEQVRFTNFSIHELGMVGITQSEASQEISLAPNPAHETIILNGLPKTPVRIVIRNGLGQVMSAMGLSNQSSVTIHIQDWPKGAYYCSITTEATHHSVSFQVL